MWFVGTLYGDCDDHAKAIEHYLEAFVDLSAGQDGTEIQRDLAASYDALNNETAALDAATTALNIHRRDVRGIDAGSVLDKAVTELGLLHVIAVLQHTNGDADATLATLLSPADDVWLAAALQSTPAAAESSYDDADVHACASLLHSLFELAVGVDSPSAARFYAETSLSLLRPIAESVDVAFAAFTLAQVCMHAHPLGTPAHP